MTGPVPGVIEAGGSLVTVKRAWPAAGQRLRFEGRDEAGRVRAGTMTLGLVPKVDLLDHGQDRKLPDLPAAMRGGELVLHRAGKRAVVRKGARYIKVVRRGDAAALAESAEAGRRRAVQAGMLAPKVLEVAAGWLSTSTVPGGELHSAARTATAQQWRNWWDQWADQWPHFVLGDHRGLTLFTAQNEATVVQAAVDRALAWDALADPSGRGRQRTAEVCQALVEVTAPRLGVAHRDLHDKQLFGGPKTIGVLDFDTACVAEPALDMANLAVHAQWRATQGVWTVEQAEVACAAVRQVAEELGVHEERFAAYAASTSLRLAALYAFRPRWRVSAIAWWDQEMRKLS